MATGSYAMTVTTIRSDQLATFKGSDGMIVFNTDTDQMILMDGQTAGGNVMLTEDEVEDLIAAEVANFTASGGQTLPTLGTPTTAGSVVVWDGSDWDESADFALKADVAQNFADLAPASGDTATGDALRWVGGKLQNFTLPAGGGGGGVLAPSKTTDADKALGWNITSGTWEERDVFELKTDVTSKLAALKGNPTTYTTIQALDSQVKVVTTSTTNLQATLGTKPNKPARGPNVGELLTWDHANGVFDYTSGFATDSELSTKSNKPAASSITSSTQDQVLAWDASANSGEGAFLQKDMAVYAKIGTATTFTDLGLVETNLNLKAPKPPNGIQAGEFLRWDETNGVFTFATPAGGGGGSSIPTPATTTDYTTAGAMQVLIWDQTSGDLKNVASPFVEPPPASASGEYLRWDAATGWVNDTPAVGGGGVAQPPDSAAGEFLRWNPALNSGAGDWENLIPDSINAPASATPASSTIEGWALTYDGSGNLVNSSGYAMIGTSSYTSLEDVETALNVVSSAMSSIPLAAPNQPAANQYLYADHVGAWQYGDLTDLVANNTADTPTDHVLVYNSTSKQLETKSWDLAGPLEIVDNGTEYVIQIKASLGL